MLKKNISLFLLLMIAVVASAQEGIKFNQTTNWKEAIAKAKQEDKLIFLDCYTSWCAPCKWMDKNVFTDETVASFFNEKFVNVKIDMEKGEGIELRKKYNVQSFPTFLFINGHGDVVHRTASKMSVEEFLAEGEKAVSPKGSLSFLNEKYEEGQRDIPFVLEYYLVVAKSDRSKAEKLGQDIVKGISEEELNSELGWKAIKSLARSETDRLGAHFMANQDRYAAWGSKEEIDQTEERLITSSMYSFIRTKNEAAFMEKLPYFKNSDQLERRKQGFMLEADFYLEMGRAKDYKKVTNLALKTDLKNDGDKLIFLARRANQKEMQNPVILKQAYLMAKRAVVLQPEEYSTQSTFAHICLSMNKKKEALAAATITRRIADAETSKIQNIAQELLDKVKLMK